MGVTMRAVAVQPKIKVMDFSTRPLTEADIAQSAEIERDVFPTHFPSTSFRRELKNRATCYLVACREDDIADDQARIPPAPRLPDEDGGRPLIGKLLDNARSLWPRRYSSWEPGQQFIAGFLGIWYAVDEAHIVSIGVRRDYRGRGIGDLLLIGALEQAMARGARVVTLEVRRSNYVARNLYRKYGFKERGVRKSYYNDNREDAIIMTTDPVHLSPFPQELLKLVREHERRWGRAERLLV